VRYSSKLQSSYNKYKHERNNWSLLKPDAALFKDTNTTEELENLSSPIDTQTSAGTKLYKHHGRTTNVSKTS